MPLTAKEVAQLKKIIQISTDLLEKAGKTVEPAVKGKSQSRIRRSGKELAEFRKMLKAERKRGVPVAALAKQHGVSAAYIYQMG